MQCWPCVYCGLYLTMAYSINSITTDEELKQSSLLKQYVNHKEIERGTCGNKSFILDNIDFREQV